MVIVLNQHSLRNREHYNFNHEFCLLVKTTTPQALGIEQDFGPFQNLLDQENLGIEELDASIYAQDVKDSDHRRRVCIRGMHAITKAYCLHCDPDISAGAKRLMAVFKGLGNIPKMPYPDETVAIKQLLEYLTGETFLDDANAIHLDDWMPEAQAANDAFIALEQSRYHEGAIKSNVNVKATRKAIDVLFDKMIELIEAKILLASTPELIAFVNELNQRIQYYNNLLDIRRGRHAAAASEDTPPAAPQG